MQKRNGSEDDNSPSERSNNPQFMCPICFQKFANAVRYWQHMQSHQESSQDNEADLPVNQRRTKECARSLFA